MKITDEELRERVRQLRAWASSRINHCASLETQSVGTMSSEAFVERRALQAVLDILDDKDQLSQTVPPRNQRSALDEMLASLESKKTTHRDVHMSDRVAAALSNDGCDRMEPPAHPTTLGDVWVGEAQAGRLSADNVEALRELREHIDSPRHIRYLAVLDKLLAGAGAAKGGGRESKNGGER